MQVGTISANNDLVIGEIISEKIMGVAGYVTILERPFHFHGRGPVDRSFATSTRPFRSSFILLKSRVSMVSLSV